MIQKKIEKKSEIKFEKKNKLCSYEICVWSWIHVRFASRISYSCSSTAKSSTKALDEEALEE